MTCREAEPLLALWVGEDLDETAALSAHVKQCEGCAALLEELQQSQSWMQILRQAEPSEVELVAVRGRVLSRVRVSRGFAWWAVGAAAAVFAGICWIGLGARQPQQTVPVSVVLPAPMPLRRTEIRVPAPPTPQQPRRGRVTPAAQRVGAGIRNVQLVPRRDEAPEIHFQTENPNVLIVLIPEAGEDFDETR